MNKMHTTWLFFCCYIPLSGNVTVGEKVRLLSEMLTKFKTLMKLDFQEILKFYKLKFEDIYKSIATEQFEKII